MAGEIDVTLSALHVSGAASAEIGDESLLVPGGLPGERVRVKRLRSVGRHTLAEIVSVLDASPQRVVPRCRHASDCGGCAWQHVAYPEQLRLKTSVLEERLSRVLGERAPRVAPMLGMPVGADGMPWGFRQKSAFVFGQQAGRLTMGHFARGTHEVVPVVECPVHPERANRIAFALRDRLQRAGVTSAGDDLRGLARHVLVRTSRDGREAVAVLVATRGDPALEAPLRALLAGPDKPEGLALNLHDRRGPFLVGRETRRIGGSGHVKETSLGPAFLVSPTAFFQTNVTAAATLLRLVVEGCEGVAKVLDLYSGSGLFALPLALRGHAVTAVEESRKAGRDAELNRRTNGVSEERLRLVCASVESALPWLAKEGFDAVVLDPPREGAPPEVLSAVFRRLRPARGILVSCNPDALARELAVALAAGYRARTIQPVDMFPHTPHIEAVAVLERADPVTRPARGHPTSRRPRRRA